MIALIVIGAIAISIGAIFISGHFGLPYVPLIAPDPSISGYIGYYAGLIALVVIPLILLVKMAINFIGGYKSSIRFKRAISGIWIVSFMIFLLTGIFTVRNFVYEARVSEVIAENSISQDQPLQINVNKLERSSDLRIQFSESAFLSKGHLYNRENVGVRIKPTDGDKVRITKIGTSRGLNHRSAVRNMRYPRHEVSLNENTIRLDEYYTLGRQDKFRGQSLNYEIDIPLGTIVTLDGPSSIFRNREFRLKSGSEKDWVMTEDGLQINSES